MKQITLIPLKTPIIKKGDSVGTVLYKAIQEFGIPIDDGDIIVIAETPVAVAEGQIVKLESITPSSRATQLAIKYQMDARVVELVLQEADEILGGVNNVLLTIKNNTLIANAGIDLSNAPIGHVILYPKNPQQSLRLIRRFLEDNLQKKIAVILGDSRVQPLRRGTIGVAMAVVGMEPVEDFRGRRDLYGRELQITFRALADNLVSAAELLLGEADEQIPAVLIKGISFQAKEIPTYEMEIPRDQCLFMNSFSKD